MKGIIFQPDLVGVLLARGEIQTRRVIKNIPESAAHVLRAVGESQDGNDWKFYSEPVPGVRVAATGWIKCPYGRPGSTLYIKEAHTYADVIRSQYDSDLIVVDYREHSNISIERRFCPVDEWVADVVSNWIAGREVDGDGDNWRSPLFMPEWATRAKVEITSVRVERVQDIDHRDIVRSGVGDAYKAPEQLYPMFAALWDQLNAQRGYSWAVNPWVWVLDLKLVQEAA